MEVAGIIIIINNFLFKHLAWNFIKNFPVPMMVVVDIVIIIIEVLSTLSYIYIYIYVYNSLTACVFAINAWNCYAVAGFWDLGLYFAWLDNICHGP